MDDKGVVGGDVERRRWPCVVDAYDAAGEEAIGVDVVDVGDVPPDFVDACDDGEGLEGEEGDQGEGEGGHGRKGTRKGHRTLELFNRRVHSKNGSGPRTRDRAI